MKTNFYKKSSAQLRAITRSADFNEADKSAARLILRQRELAENETGCRTIAEIAKDIKEAWPNPYFGAVPYLNAMLCIHSDNRATHYYEDTAGDIIDYFLANAQSFRGAGARALKAELKSLKDY